MTTQINSELEKVLLAGGTVIKTGSEEHSLCDPTHILVKCPEHYGKEQDQEGRPINFATFEICYGNWYLATRYYSTKSYAVKSFIEKLKDDQNSNFRKKLLASQVAKNNS